MTRVAPNRWPSIYEIQREEMEAEVAAQRPPPRRGRGPVMVVDGLYPSCGMVAAAGRRGRGPTCGGRPPPGPQPGGGDPQGNDVSRPAFPTAEAIHTLPAGSYRPDQAMDVHELLKQMMFATSSPACDDHFEKNRPCPSTIYGVSDQYMVLDSFEKLQESPVEVGEFQFNFMVQGVTRNQNIGVKETLNTVIGIQCYEFCIPVLPIDNFDPATAVTLAPNLAVLGLAANGALPVPPALNPISDARSQIPFCKRVTMYFKEIGLQSYSDTNNRRHHFEFRAEMADIAVRDRVRLSPIDFTSSYFLFTEPIQAIHGLTVAFYNPGEVLRFPPDILYMSSAASDAGQLLEFSYHDPTNLINLAPGDRIYVKGFATGNPVLDRWVTRPEGQLVGAGGFLLVPPAGPSDGTTVTFRLNPDVSVAAFYPPGVPIPSTEQIDIYIAKNRLRIPLRFRKVVPKLTNYVSP